ncbi:MAG TPA: pyruvate kinase [Polyangia bacterium]|nr:pyruvate kinase [Polyangia bacterium]
MSLRHAKIVCTLGPATDDVKAMAALIDAGMDVARLNYSHGSYEEHARRLAAVREGARVRGKPIAILQDLQGPKIRTGRGAPAQIADGATIALVEGSAGSVGSNESIAVEYPGLGADLHAGDVVRLDDGRIVLHVEKIDGGRVICAVVQGGALRDRMGVNLPSKRVRIPALTDHDRRDLEHGLSLGVDYVALSFVKRADDIVTLREACRNAGRPTPIVAKIETPEAVDNLWEIVAAADVVMVARGDLGVELSPEQVPVAQKEIIGSCRLQQTPVIVATEMLQSMVESTRPTRAEASDVASAVFEGADALMLSAETAMGKHSHEACSMMARIIEQAEASRFYAPPPSEPGRSTREAIAHAACNIARDIGARVLVAFTESGGTPRLISKARPGAPIVAFAGDEATLRQLALYWGVVPRLLTLPSMPDTDTLVDRVTQTLLEQKLVTQGDKFVIAFGSPVGQRTPTNAIGVISV